MCKALINGHNSFISFPMHMIVKQQSGKGPFTSYFRPVIFMENELKPVPDSTHMYLNPLQEHQRSSFHPFSLHRWVGRRREVVMRHPHRQDGELPSASLGPCRGQGEQETGCRSDAGEAARAAQPLTWHRAAELTAKTTQMEVHDLEGPLQSQRDSTFQIAMALNE